jgi:hypothetical protein
MADLFARMVARRRQRLCRRGQTYYSREPALAQASHDVAAPRRRRHPRLLNGAVRQCK